MALFVGVLLRGEGPEFQLPLGGNTYCCRIVFKNFEIARAIWFRNWYWNLGPCVSLVFYIVVFFWIMPTPPFYLASKKSPWSLVLNFHFNLTENVLKYQRKRAWRPWECTRFWKMCEGLTLSDALSLVKMKCKLELKRVEKTSVLSAEVYHECCCCKIVPFQFMRKIGYICICKFGKISHLPYKCRTCGFVYQWEHGSG